jgi:hypothetical protein
LINKLMRGRLHYKTKRFLNELAGMVNQVLIRSIEFGCPPDGVAQSVSDSGEPLCFRSRDTREKPVKRHGIAISAPRNAAFPKHLLSQPYTLVLESFDCQQQFLLLVYRFGDRCGVKADECTLLQFQNINQLFRQFGFGGHYFHKMIELTHRPPPVG